MNAPLPATVLPLVKVLGRERALYLVGRLPRFRRVSGGDQVILYVPRTLRPDNVLVKILGWNDAERLCLAYGGEIFHPGNCYGVYRKVRDDAIRQCYADGVPIEMLCEWFGVGRRRICQLLEIPQEVTASARQNNPRNPQHNRKRAND